MAFYKAGFILLRYCTLPSCLSLYCNTHAVHADDVRGMLSHGMGSTTSSSCGAVTEPIGQHSRNQLQVKNTLSNGLGAK